MDSSNISVVSCNCKGFNVSKVLCISKILKDFDVLLLQETWLFSLIFFPYISNVHGGQCLRHG